MIFLRYALTIVVCFPFCLWLVVRAEMYVAERRQRARARAYLERQR